MRNVLAHPQCGRADTQVVTGYNPNDLDIWTDWCRLGLQFVVYKSADRARMVIYKLIFVALIWLANV